MMKIKTGLSGIASIAATIFIFPAFRGLLQTSFDTLREQDRAAIAKLGEVALFIVLFVVLFVVVWVLIELLIRQIAPD